MTDLQRLAAMLPTKACEIHERQLADLDRARFIAESLLLHAVMHGPAIAMGGDCAACRLPADEVDRVLTKAALIEAQAEDLGGSYTTDDMMLVRGRVKP